MIPTPSSATPQRNMRGIPPAVLMRAYQLGWSLSEMAQAFALSRLTIQSRLRSFGVQLRPKGGVRGRVSPPLRKQLGNFGKVWIR